MRNLKKRRYWREIGVLGGFFVVSAAVFAGGLLLMLFGPAWATEQNGYGRGSGPLAMYVVLIGLTLLLIALGGILRRLVKGPTPPGRHSADPDN